MKGRKITVQEVLQEVGKDRPFYERSGGGVTLSGGEPLAQIQFCRELLKQLKHESIHTVVDTSGHAPWGVLESILEWTDLFLYDVKCHNPELHRRLTGVDGTMIRSNLRKLLMRGVPLIVRIPLIPGYNDQPVELERIADMIQRTRNSTHVHILPYHHFAEQKYGRVGKSYRLKGVKPPSPDYLRRLGRIFETRDIPLEIMGLEENSV